MLLRRTMEIFREICRYPHCSGETEALRDYLIGFAERVGYTVKVDAAGNMVAYTPRNAKMTLQSHYDMVCIGTAPHIETYQEDGWLRAKESSLGADNGIGVAMTLALMEADAAVDALFTNDEEIGLVGASRLALPIRTSTLLNLDYEEAEEICIGCAGGEDIYAEREMESLACQGGYAYRIRAEAPGGHSGVNIADGIPNAITRLCGHLCRHDGWEIATLRGGERINAIPRRAEAVVRSDGPMTWRNTDGVTVEPLSEPVGEVVADGVRVVRALYGFAHGVRAWNRDLDVPQSSINLAQVTLDTRRCDIALSARAMSDDDLADLVDRTAAGWEACGFTCRTEGKYPAWKPAVTPFAEKVRDIYRHRLPDADFTAIHAGLECAVFTKQYPDLAICSIGPTIHDPHSDRERLQIASLDGVVETVRRLVEEMS